jgi:nucleoside-diphosphate-sugar epimerase
MNVFILGATGYIGSIVAERIQRAGHHVLGLARSDKSAGRLAATGIEPVRGSLDNHRILADAAVRADAIIHCAFDLGGGDFLSAVRSERAAVRTILDSIRHVDKTLIVTSGTAVLGDTGDRIFSEDTPIPQVNGIPAASPQAHAMRAIGERLAMEEDVLAPAVAPGHRASLTQRLWPRRREGRSCVAATSRSEARRGPLRRRNWRPSVVIRARRGSC